MREMDRRTIEEVGVAGVILMEVAGREAARVLHEAVVHQHGGKAKTVAIVCGGGNNGGDGYVMARHLDSMGYDVDVFLMTFAEAIRGDAWTNLEILRRLRPTISVLSETVPDMTADALHEGLPYYDIYVDALLGTGLESEVRGNYRNVLRYMNEARGIKFAVDIPSGLDANTGRPHGIAFEADYTTTFGMAKLGLLLDPGRAYTGELTVVDIGILPETADQVGIQGERLIQRSLQHLAFPRPPEAHKGDFGHVGLVVGSAPMPGAAALATGAALASGVGLTSVCTRESVRPIVASHHPEAMPHPILPEERGLDPETRKKFREFLDKKTGLAVGPGLGQEPLVRDVLESVLSGHTPVVIDADGLNVLAQHPDLLKDTFCPVILTPHPGEMSRLTNVPIEKGIIDPLEWTMRLAERSGCFVVFKTSTTIICSPDGRFAVNNTGNPGMASGGTGDVLTGLLAGLLAIGMTPWDACRLAVFGHGRAGDLAAAEIGQRGLKAGDVLRKIPEALAFLE